MLHMMQRPNSRIVYYLLKIIPSLKTQLKHAYVYLHRCYVYLG